MKKKNKNNEEPRINFDGTWKTIIELIFEDCLAFFLPELHQDVDFTKEVTFLSQDAFKIAGGKDKKGDHVMDILAQVYLKNGQKKCVYVHMEVERGHEGNFSERMYVSHNRIRDKHGKNIVALAIFLGDTIPKDHNKYAVEQYGTKVTYEYNTYNIRDQKDKIAALKANKNPFAIAVLAVLYINQTSYKDLDRKAYKWQLLQLALERNYPKTKINALLNFLEHIVVLTSKYEAEVKEQLLTTYHTKPEAMKFSSYEMILINAYSEKHYGDTADNVYQAFTKKISQTEAQLAEKERRAEQEQRRAEQEQKRAEQERKTREALEQKLRNQVIKFDKLGYGLEQMVDLLDLSESFIKEVLKNESKK